jgi:acetylornithine/succinyldiaminopimelate/putrescine aminotransferase
MEKSFHGRSLATLAATGQDKIHKGFYPLVPGFHYARFNDIDSVKEKITPQTCAVMLEPVQGEGGIYVARKEFLRDLRALCSEKKILLVFDEVQCGLGRTGKFFAYEHYGLKPDVLTLAKAIASGIPMGVMIAAGPYSDILGKGNHASTFGGNPLACAVSLKVVEIISRKKFLDSIIVKGNFFKDSLEKLKTGFSFIKEVRGLGLMLGMEVDGQAPQIAKAAFGRGLLINAVGDNILRFLPPLVITKREISQGLRILEEVLKNI